MDEFSWGVVITICAGIFTLYLVFTSKNQTKQLIDWYGYSKRDYDNRESNSEALKEIKEKGKLLKGEGENDDQTPEVNDTNDDTNVDDDIKETELDDDIHNLKNFNNFGLDTLTKFHKAGLFLAFPRFNCYLLTR